MTNEQKNDQRIQRLKSNFVNIYNLAVLMDWSDDELNKLCELSPPKVANVEYDIFFGFRKMIMDEREAQRNLEFTQINEKFISQSIENEKLNQKYLRSMKILTFVLATATALQALFLALTYLSK